MDLRPTLPPCQALPPLPHLLCVHPHVPCSPVLLEAVGGCYDPAVRDERPPTDVSAPNLEAGLPGPLTLRRHGPAHDAAGGALKATVWGCGEGQGWPETSEEWIQREMEKGRQTGRPKERWRGMGKNDPEWVQRPDGKSQVSSPSLPSAAPPSLPPTLGAQPGKRALCPPSPVAP